MSTNVFNTSAMAAVAAAALTNGNSSRHHHHSAVGSQSTMLFPPTPVAGTSLGMANSSTAFPFPPPSPLFLSSINLLQPSSQQQHPGNHSHMQHLSPWISPGTISSLSSHALTNGKILCDTKEFASDNNNNDLMPTSGHNSLPSTPIKPKLRSLEHDLVGKSSNNSNSHDHHESSRLNHREHLKEYSNGLFETHKDNNNKFAFESNGNCNNRKNYSPLKSSSSNSSQNHNHNNSSNSRSDNNISWSTSSEASTESMHAYGNGSPSPQIKSSSGGKHPDSVLSSKLSDSGGTTSIPNSSMLFKSSPSSAFLLPSYVTNNSPTVPSPTYPIGIRPPPPSPQTPTQHASFGAHYPHYLLPPSLYSYYHNQQQQSASQSSFSPTNQSQSSPISPFLVPNLPQSASPSMISAANGLTSSVPSMFDAYSHQNHAVKSLDNVSNEQDTLKENHSSQKHSSRNNTNSQVIDLTSNRNGDNDDSPVDCSKPQSYSPQNKLDSSKHNHELFNSLKRKSPVEDAAEKQNGIASHSEPDEADTAISRKHRILKPPNINITDCEYRNGFVSAFLPSPLFPQHFSSHLPSSPFTYLDHIPLSAPPIAASHHSSSKCFDFPAQPEAFTFTPPHRLLSASSKDVPVSQAHINQQFSSANSSPTAFSSGGKSKSLQTSNKSDIRNSIMKDGKKKAPNSNSNSISEPKVTFQVPLNPSNKNTGENQENRYSLLSPRDNGNKNSKVLNSNNNNRKSHQYPEYFKKGSTIKLGNGCLKKVEELSTEDFIESALFNGKFKVEQSEVVQMKEKPKKGIVRIVFLVGQSRVKVSLDSPIEHPFYVYKKGWSSFSPAATSKRYGLNCHRLSSGDKVVTLANKPTVQSPSKAFSSQKISRLLASSSGSLSSASSSSSSSLTSTSGINTNSNNLQYSSPSSHSALQQSASLSQCPPPAHLNETSHKSLLHSSNSETALNLDVKFNNSTICNKKKPSLKTDNNNHRDSGINHSSSSNNNNNSSIGNTATATNNEVADEDEEEIDVEKVDDEENTSHGSKRANN